MQPIISVLEQFSLSMMACWQPTLSDYYLSYYTPAGTSRIIAGRWSGKSNLAHCITMG